MYKLHYNYVFFDAPDRWSMENKDGYYYICMEDLHKCDNVQIVSAPLSYTNRIIRSVWLVHFISKMPFIKWWYPYYFKDKFWKQDKPYCFICCGSYITIDYVKYLKKRYPGAKFVKLHRDLLKFFQSAVPEWTNEKLKEEFDLWMSIDREEAKKNEMIHFDEFESKIDVPISDEYPLYDVFFAGLAKDRLPLLLKVYKLFTDAGLSVEYYLTGVPVNERKSLSGIIYADKPMTYRQFLFKTINSKCILEINQEGAVGYTSRFLEAVMYNRRLVTNNMTIMDSPFYDDKKILCVKDFDESVVKFVKESLPVDYGYTNEFSPIHLIEKIDKLLEGN